jgi:hypothetical protein
MVPAPGAAHSLIAAQLAIRLHGPARAAGLVVSVDFNLGTEDDYLKLSEHISRDRELAEGLVRRRQARRFPSRQRDHELGPALAT